MSRESATTSAYAVNTVNLRHRWLPASGLANELSLQFVRWSNENRRLAADPELRYPTFTIGRASQFGAINEKQFRVIDRVTYGLGSGPGSHLFKAGLEVSRVNADQFTPNNGPGVFRFGTETGNPFEASIGIGFFDPLSDRDAFSELWGWVAGVYFNDEMGCHTASRFESRLPLRCRQVCRARWCSAISDRRGVQRVQH